jgi:hypothetical protein
VTQDLFADDEPVDDLLANDGGTGDATEGEGANEGVNNRSTIAFPYSHLEDAERVAEALHRRGNTAKVSEVAAALDTTTTSGAFRTKMSTARVFGAIDIRRGNVTLTELGQRLIDPEKRDRARVDAFLHVPLYDAIYKHYDNGVLPQASGLEAAIQQLGVSPKQLQRARQTLLRSAERAGFFRSGRNRLVIPPAGASASDDEGEGAGAGSGGGANVGPVGTLPALMVEMWITLLRGEGAKWPPEKVAEFVKTAQRLDKILAGS